MPGETARYGSFFPPRRVRWRSGQSMLPNTWINIDNVILAPWPEWQGKLAISMTPVIQQIRYQGEKVKLSGSLRRWGSDRICATGEWTGR